MLDKLFWLCAAHFIGAALTLKILNNILPDSLTYYYASIAKILLFLVLSWYSFIFVRKSFWKEEINPQNKAVFITGCDSGFGHNLAKRLDSKGFNVFAACLFPFSEATDQLRQACSSRLQILELDVTKEESVKEALLFVEQNLNSSELWAIVNNAGIGKGFSVELSRIQDFKDCMEVNVFGMIRVTKAFLPLLKKSKGRVINMTSILGRSIIPHYSPYVISKHAAVGFTDALRQELSDLNLDVISIEPELFATKLICAENMETNCQTVFKGISESLKEEYDQEYQKYFKNFVNKMLNFAAPNIKVVIDDLESAVILKYPEPVYYPRRNNFVRLLLFLYAKNPIPIRDLCVKIVLNIFKYERPKNINHTS